MLRAILAFVIALPAFANAQESMKYYYTVQECGPPGVMFSTGVDLEEDILFVGTSVTFDMQGIPHVGSMMFAVNQLTGTWTMYTLYGDGTVCYTALGSDFEPG